MLQNRTKEFSRNIKLETLLTDVNDSLAAADDAIAPNFTKPPFPFIFIVGCHRSGTTLFLQWLANSGLFSYPSNLLSRFYKAPITGAKIQLLLTSPEYQFRNELFDLHSEINFKSQNGKTEGALAPNEFWYFWRRFLQFKESNLDYKPTQKLLHEVDTERLKSELSGLSTILGKPLALKALILNYNIDFLYSLFKNSLFIYIKRDPLSNIESILNARQRQSGDKETWYSFKIPEYYELKDLAAHEQAAGQVFHINNAINFGLQSIPERNQLCIQYEEFCKKPEVYFDSIKEKMNILGYPITTNYNQTESFQIKNKQNISQLTVDAWNKFHKGI